jgi:hypothetical protein
VGLDRLNPYGKSSSCQHHVRTALINDMRRYLPFEGTSVNVHIPSWGKL